MSIAIDIGAVDRVLFDSKIDKGEDCWNWTAGTTGRGYGAFHIKRHNFPAHRVAYALAFGDPGRSVVRHDCDNPLCVNPAHLLTGTHGDNADDKVSRNRQARGADINGKLTEEDVKAIRDLRYDGWYLREIAERYGVSITATSRS